MAGTKIIKAVFGAVKSIITQPRYRYDYGQILEVSGITLPESFEARFSNAPTGESVRVLGQNQRVAVPDNLMWTGKSVWCYITVHDEVTDGRTMYTIQIPIRDATERTNVEPTPVQQDVIEQAIAALNAAVEKTAQDVESADASAQSTKADADRAETARDTTEGYVDDVQNYAQQAQTSANNASASATASAQSASTAQQIKTDVQELVDSAVSASELSLRYAETSGHYKTQAEESASSASQSAETASTKASEASASAQTATTKASEASQSASTASAAATSASTSAQTATTAAATATTAKTDAESARDAAAQSASEAAESARTLTIDSVPTQGSTNAVSSGGVYSALDTLQAQIPQIDSTLSQSGQAADAKVVGDKISELKEDLSESVGDLKSAIINVDDILYPNKNFIITTILPAAQANTNTYYDISKLAPGNSYKIALTISNAVHLANVRTSKTESGSGNVDNITDEFSGDAWSTGKVVIYTPSVEGVNYLQVQFNSAYVTDEAAVGIVVYDYTKERTTAISELKSVDAGLQSDIDAITPEIYLDDAYNLLPPSGYTVGKLILPDGRTIDYGPCVLSDYIPIDPVQEYICNYTKTASVVYGDSALTGNVNTFERTNFCFFDADKNVVPFTGNTSAVSKVIPENAKYIRVTLISETLYPLARLIYGNFNTQPIVRIVDYRKRYDDIYAEPNTGYEHFKMVMFGDSITHGSLSAGDDGISYVDYANDYLRSNIINVGFGGTRMTYPTIEGASLFCFRNLVDCIVSDDATAWDALDAYASSDNTSYLPHLNKLKAVEWDKIHAIGLMYGANDFTSNTPVGSAYNEDVLNFDGACASAIKKLLTKYPHLQVIIFAPFDRMMNISDPTTMTDTAPNNSGLYMSDYANSLENVVSKFHCPLIKTGELFGINAQTILTYAPDGTHPRSNVAQKRLGWLFAQAVKTNIAPFN